MQLSDRFGTGFRLPPPLPGPWKSLPGDAAEILVSRLAETGISHGARRVVAMRMCALGFFPGWLLCDVEFESGDAETIGGLFGPDGWTALDGTAERIHQHNARHGVALSGPDSWIAYLRFFCAFVHGEDGPFSVVDTTTPLLRIGAAAPEPVDPASISDPSALPATDDRPPLVTATVLYGRTLFRAEFVIQPGGMVRMVDEDMISENVVAKPEIEYSDGARRFFHRAGE